MDPELEYMVVGRIVKVKYRLHLDHGISILYLVDSITSRDMLDEYRTTEWIGIECEEEGRMYTPQNIIFRHNHKDEAIYAWRSRYPEYTDVIDHIIEG